MCKFLRKAGEQDSQEDRSYILDNFEGSDVGQFCVDELPDGRLLALELLPERLAVHNVRPVLLQAVQG